MYLNFIFRNLFQCALLNIIIAVVILASTWSLLKESLRLSLDGVLKGIDIEHIKKEASKIKDS